MLRSSTVFGSVMSMRSVVRSLSRPQAVQTRSGRGRGSGCGSSYGLDLKLWLLQPYSTALVRSPLTPHNTPATTTTTTNGRRPATAAVSSLATGLAAGLATGCAAAPLAKPVAKPVAVSCRAFGRRTAVPVSPAAGPSGGGGGSAGTAAGNRKICVSVSSWFCLPEQGMAQFEVLVRASGFLLPNAAFAPPTASAEVSATANS